MPTPFETEMVADGAPIAWWRFQETSGTTAADTQGTYPGTYVGSPPLGGAGIPGGSASVELGNNQYVDMGNVLPIRPDKSFTIAAWIKLPSWLTTWATIISKGDSTWRIARNSGSTESIQASISSSNVTSFGTDLDDDIWHQIVMTYDGTTLRLYIDGVQVATQASTGDVGGPTAHTVRIGGNSETGGRFLGGDVAEVAIYDYTRTAARILSTYDAGATTPPPVPDPPINLVADPSATDVALTWDPPLASTTAPTGYTVSVDGGTPVDVGLVLSYLVTGLTPSTLYSIDVRAYAAPGTSTPANVAVTTDAGPPVPPPGGYAAHLRVGTHEWDVLSTDAPDYGPVAGIRFGWSARQDDGWPTQHDPTILSFGVVVATGADFDDVDQGEAVHFTFTPDGYADPLVTFGGTVRDLVARPVSVGMLYEIVAVDHLQKLQEDYTTGATFAAGSPVPDVWPGLIAGTTPALPDPMGAVDYPGESGGFLPLAGPLELLGSTWDVLGGMTSAYTVRDGSTPLYQRVILTYQLDGSGDLLSTQPFLGTWAPHDPAATVELDGCLIPTESAEWSRPRIEPNVVIDTGGLTFDRPHTGVDIVRRLESDVIFTETSPTWILDGVEAASQWSTQLEYLAHRDPSTVADWFTLPDAMRTMVEAVDIDPRHTPDGTGTYAGMLAGAALLIRPGRAWTVAFSLRRTLPDLS